MFKPLVVFIFALALAPSGLAAERFSGSAKLAANPAPISANDRFSVTAELQAANELPKTTANGRFSLIAGLFALANEQIGNAAAPKSALTACGLVSPDIFKNGFEN
jgi:hypothetical protein